MWTDGAYNPCQGLYDRSCFWDIVQQLLIISWTTEFCNMWDNDKFSTVIPIPAEYQQLLPEKNLSVLNFPPLSLPPIMLDTKLTTLDAYFSPDEPNVDDAEEIKLVPLPPLTIISSLDVATVPDAQSIHCCHFLTSQPQRFPLWIVIPWKTLAKAKGAQRKWVQAYWALEKRMNSLKLTDPVTKKLLSDSHAMLSSLEWSGRLKGFDINPDIIHLTSFLTNEWLNNDHSQASAIQHTFSTKQP